jgi:hypothetical protein
MTIIVNDITDAAYLKCGIKTPDSIKDSEALKALNNMLGSWSIDVIIPVFTQIEYDLVVGRSEYTVGPGGNFGGNLLGELVCGTGVLGDITVRPINIASAYLKDFDGYSYPLKIISSQDYNRVGQKALRGRPESFFYCPAYPLGKIYFNKEADKIYTVCFESVHHLTEFASIDTQVSLPNEYKEAFVYNLAVRLAENNSVKLIQSVIALAQTTYTALSKITAVNQMPPIARFDFGHTI